MAGYSPLKIVGNSTGLVQNREEFLLPDDAYPTLQNAYVWRERIKRKKGYKLLGRLRRNLVTQSLGDTIATGVQFNLFTQINLTGSISAITQASPGQVTTSTNHLLQTGQYVFITGVGGMTEVNGKTFKITVTGVNTFTIGVDTTTYGAYTAGGTWETNDLSSETIKAVVPGTIVITMPGPIVFTDQGNGTLTSPTPGNSGVINYATGNITLTTTAGAGESFVSFSYYPNLPVMGIRLRELQNSSNDQTVIFDQIYAYIFNAITAQFEEFIPGTTWNASNATVVSIDFFFSTNYWVSANPPFGTTNRKLFWVTNNTGSQGANADPPRITDGVTWVDFDSSTWNRIDATTYLFNFLAMLPYRGRMVTFNTWEGTDKAQAKNYTNRIRWSTIGNPFIPYDAGPPAKGSWRSDIRGQGGFLDIPTSEDIVAIGFVRDNLVIYCERSTWQLRYTGRSIAPFQIERVNSELGAEGTFSPIQFDTSLIGIGDKGVVQCDSYKSERIDIKIPDFVFRFNSLNNGVQRVHGVRDFPNRLAYWTIPYSQSYDANVPTTSWIFPNQRLVYNYENDSWALFNDSLTTLGTYQAQAGRTWLNTPEPWIKCNFIWISQPQSFPSIIGGNQQGFVEVLNELTTNDVSLFITDIQANVTLPTVVYSPNHNMQTGFVIGISRILGTPYSNLNNGIFSVVLGDNDGLNTANCFRLYKYDSSTGQFSTPQLDVLTDPYLGGGLINIRENFSIISKKFNFIDDGQNIQMGYVDVLMPATGDSNPGSISLNVFLDYDDDNVYNVPPENTSNDTFFNVTIPTNPSILAPSRDGSKFWQRVYCPVRGNFITLKYTFSNEQMAGIAQQLNVEIDAQILWIRKAGRLSI